MHLILDNWVDMWLYYCGPASAQMIIKFETGEYYSQSYIASKINMSNGTSHQEMKDVLSFFNVNYSVIWATSGTERMMADMIYAIGRNNPNAIHVKGYALPGYSPTVGGHWVVGSGYDLVENNNSYDKVRVNDPYYNAPNGSGMYIYSASDFYKAFNLGGRVTVGRLVQ